MYYLKLQEMAITTSLGRRMAIAVLCAGAMTTIIGFSPEACAEQVAPMVITCFGDSVTEGVGSGGSQYTYPSQMGALLDSGFSDKTFDVHNRGVGGYRAEHVIALLQNEGLPEDPDFVLLMIGGNDIAEATIWTLGTIISQTVAEVQTSVNLIKEHVNADGSHPTLIVSTFIPNLLYGSWGSWAISQYNNSLLNPSKLSGYDLMITSNWSDFYETGSGHAKNELMSDDVHPNATGYGIMAQNWFEALCTFPSMKDTDGDGLSDAEEDADGDGVWDQGTETNFNNADTDGDGVSDLVEVTCADVVTALQATAKPSLIKVNFQPPRVVVADGYLQDSAISFTSFKGFGWLGM